MERQRKAECKREVEKLGPRQRLRGQTWWGKEEEGREIEAERMRREGGNRDCKIGKRLLRSLPGFKILGL